MDLAVSDAARARLIDLPGRGGAMAGFEIGPSDRPIDIVFVHANGFNAATYRSILAPLGDSLRVLAVDQRGHGRSTLPAESEGRGSWYDLRDDLLALLATLDLRDMILSGHSMGGAAGVLAQALAPERVKSLVLFDPVVIPPTSGADVATTSPLVAGALRRRAVFPGREAVIAAYSGRGAFATWTPRMLADYVAEGFVDRPDGQVELACAPAWEASNFTSHQHDTLGAFEAARVPIRILRAEHASTCRDHPRLAALEAAGRIAMETIAGTSHFLPMERPDLVQAALRAAAES
ncbi:alpha/beta hydrolase [Phenylobacterium sp.]|uniref:alpha/beta fold hydrolase n=1 Tax=Phenylobacterium sp. TaxID=1871053 RepID=UPI00286B478B|nr:alpha/beta hydrolase [Phenylobacterium sp.]